MVACRAAVCRAAAGRTGRCRTADRRAPGRTRALSTRALSTRALSRRADPIPAHRAAVAGRTVLRRTGLPLMVLRPAAGPTPGVPAAGPTARWDPTATGRRTGAGCHRKRTACTGRRGRARRAAPQAGTTGRSPPSRIITRTAGAGRARPHPGATVRAATVRAGLVRAVPVRAGLVPVGLVHGDRRTGHRYPTGLPARPGSTALQARPGLPPQPGLRRCASTRRPGRTSRRPRAVTGPARRRSRRAR